MGWKSGSLTRRGSNPGGNSSSSNGDTNSGSYYSSVRPSSAAEIEVRKIATRIGLQPGSEILASVCHKMRKEYVVEEWQLPSLDSRQWEKLNAPIGLAAAVRHLSTQRLLLHRERERQERAEQSREQQQQQQQQQHYHQQLQQQYQQQLQQQYQQQHYRQQFREDVDMDINNAGAIKQQQMKTQHPPLPFLEQASSSYQKNTIDEQNKRRKGARTATATPHVLKACFDEKASAPTVSSATTRTTAAAAFVSSEREETKEAIEIISTETETEAVDAPIVIVATAAAGFNDEYEDDELSSSKNAAVLAEYSEPCAEWCKLGTVATNTNTKTDEQSRSLQKVVLPDENENEKEEEQQQAAATGRQHDVTTTTTEKDESDGESRNDGNEDEDSNNCVDDDDDDDDDDRGNGSLDATTPSPTIIPTALVGTNRNPEFKEGEIEQSGQSTMIAPTPLPTPIQKNKLEAEQPKIERKRKIEPGIFATASIEIVDEKKPTPTSTSTSTPLNLVLPAPVETKPEPSQLVPEEQQVKTIESIESTAVEKNAEVETVHVVLLEEPIEPNEISNRQDDTKNKVSSSPSSTTLSAPVGTNLETEPTVGDVDIDIETESSESIKKESPALGKMLVDHEDRSNGRTGIDIAEAPVAPTKTKTWIDVGDDALEEGTTTATTSPRAETKSGEGTLGSDYSGSDDVTNIFSELGTSVSFSEDEDDEAFAVEREIAKHSSLLGPLATGRKEINDATAATSTGRSSTFTNTSSERNTNTTSPFWGGEDDEITVAVSNVSPGVRKSASLRAKNCKQYPHEFNRETSSYEIESAALQVILVKLPDEAHRAVLSQLLIMANAKDKVSRINLAFQIQDLLTHLMKKHKIEAGTEKAVQLIFHLARLKKTYRVIFGKSLFKAMSTLYRRSEKLKGKTSRIEKKEKKMKAADFEQEDSKGKGEHVEGQPK